MYPLLIWIRQFTSKKSEKVNVLELDEMCVRSKKICFWTAANRKNKRLVGFYVGDRNSKSFKNLCDNIVHIDARFYATDK